MSVLYVAFKGNGNSSNKIVRSLSGDKLFLTNSYSGLKKDIENISGIYCPDCRKRITRRQTAERMRQMRGNVTR